MIKRKRWFLCLGGLLLLSAIIFMTVLCIRQQDDNNRMEKSKTGMERILQMDTLDSVTIRVPQYQDKETTSDAAVLAETLRILRDCQPEFAGEADVQPTLFVQLKKAEETYTLIIILSRRQVVLDGFVYTCKLQAYTEFEDLFNRIYQMNHA